MRDDRNGEDEYVVDLKFFKPISPSHTKIFFTPTSLCLLLRKADAGEEYWPRLREGANEFKWLERDAEKVHFALHPICSETYFVIRRKALTNLFLVILKWVVQADQNESNRIDEYGFVSINTPNLGRPPPGMVRHLFSSLRTPPFPPPILTVELRWGRCAACPQGRRRGGRERRSSSVGGGPVVDFLLFSLRHERVLLASDR